MHGLGASLIRGIRRVLFHGDAVRPPDAVSAREALQHMTISDPQRPSVLLVEDQDAARDRLARIIADHPRLQLAAAVATCAEARRELDRMQPDVLLTDIGLPDGDGIDLIRETRARGYDTEIMVVTVFGDEQHVLAAIEAGATGYLLKDASRDYIGDAILQMRAGSSPISASIARHLLKRFQAPVPEPLLRTAVIPHLTEREREVLHGLSKGFSFAEIAAMLGMSPHTVTTHVKHIYRKLEVRSRSEAVYEATQLGLLQRRG